MATPATPAPLHPPSPPSHTPVVDFALIERQKENIQPLRNGRSASALQSVFSAPRQDRVATLQAGRERHEEDIAAVEAAEAADGYDDPLEPYVKFVKWTIDNYPAGQTAESGIIPLVERTARRFKDDPRYKSDLRYLKVWVAYATYVQDPIVIYQHLLANEIGTHYALLYEEYANALERTGSREKANEIFQLGIARKAQPLNRLPSRFAEFQKRMLLAPADSVSLNSAATETPAVGRRQALAPRSVSSTNPLGSSGAPTNPAARTNSSITVFVDEENKDPALETNAWPDVGTKASRVKENTQAAGPWKGEKLKMRGPAVTGHGATPARKLDVYQDLDDAATKTPSHPLPEDVFSRSLKPSEDQLLRQDPFKNFSPTPATTANPSLLTSVSQSTGAVVQGSSLMKIGKAHITSDKPLTFSDTRNIDEPFVPQPTQRKLAPGVSKSGKGEHIRIDLTQMYKDGIEWSLDEMRARRRGMLGKTWEEEAASSSSPAPGSLDVMEPLKDEAEPGRKEAERERMTMRLDAPTVNTRAALDDVYGLFNTSPSKSEQDEPPSPINSPPRVAQTPSTIPALRQNENATARKPSGPFSTSRTPLNVFGGLSTVMATPTPAQGTLGRSASGKTLLELHVEEPEPEPVKTPHKPLDIFTDAPVTAPRSAAKAPFQIFVDETSAPPKTPAGYSRVDIQSATMSEKKPFAIFVDPDLDAPLEPSHRTSISPSQEGAPAFPLFVDPAPKPIHPQEAEHGVPQTPSPALASKVDISDTYHSSENVEKSRLFSFIDEEADARTIVSPEKAEPVQRAFVPFVDCPERTPQASSAQSQGASRSKEMQQPTGMALPMPPRPDLSQLRVAAAELEADDEPDEPQTPWSEADEERWIAQQEQERQARRNARLGNFNIMTPITERTCEFTQMGSVVGQEDNRTDEDDDDFRSRADSERADTAAWSEYVTAEEKVSDEFEIPIGGNDASLMKIEDVTPGVMDLKDLRLEGPHGQIMDQTRSPPNPCNPFDSQIQSFLLSHLPPLSANGDFHDLRPATADKMDGLQKHAKKMARKSGNTTTVLAEDRFPIALGKDSYDVKEKLGEGGFGAVFLAQLEKGEEDEDEELLDEDEDEEHLVAIKVEHPCNIWEALVLQRIQAALPERLRQSVIRPRSLYAYQDESFLVLDFCQQGTLLDAVNHASIANSSTSNIPGMDELLTMFFSIELLRLVEGMHAAGFIHGDMKIDNCLVRLDDVPGGASAWSSSYSRNGSGGWSHKGIKMIDFGRAIDTRLFPAGQQFIADWPTDERDCVEMRENRPWTYQSDYFGLASIVYCMLFGKYIETIGVPLEAQPARNHYKIANTLKRYWQCELWSRLFELLLNPCLASSDGTLPVTPQLTEIREDMESWLEANCDKAGKSLKGLLKKVELAALGKKRRY
ncbi:hypothetical protein CALCODRAFT_486276 [Calocera cornea HHB12733]|uniref:Protein kinase domain-containing protein n=1 Tax=Calocera cornea HHB12733 TaxID=1353952 RepID=A0A165DTF2_9BASI|nr:hypothetical protein CALCODRAFT_486276 [Calocera cornea HHB12733]